MAGRGAVQSSSRRATPQPQARQQHRLKVGSTAPAAPREPQRAVSRTTRSQSREPSEVAASQLVGRVTRGRARQASIESVSSSGSNAARSAHPARPRQRKGREVGIGDLTTVEEDLPTQPEQSSRDDEHNHQFALPAEPLDNTQRSPGAFSNVSGTTAVTSFSAADAADLDQDDLLHYLPILHRESEGILNIVAPDHASEASLLAIIDDFRRPGAKIVKTLNKRETSFAFPLDVFGGQDSVRPEIILKSLFPTRSVHHLESERWRPDEVLYKANLALLARDIINLKERESPEAWNVIRRLDSTFPTPFLNSLLRLDSKASTFGSSNLLEDTFNLALEVRTQLAILLPFMAPDATGFNIDNMLVEVFFEPSDVDNSDLPDLKDTVQHGQVRGWAIRGLESKDLQETTEFRQAVQKRVERIKDIFPTERRAVDNTFDPKQLESVFPWSSFVAQVLRWVRQRNREIEKGVSGKGGIDGIVKLLENEVQAYRDSSSLIDPATPAAPAASKATPKKEMQQHQVDAERSTPGAHTTPSTKSAKKAISSPYFIQHTDMLKDLERRVSELFAPPSTAPTAAAQGVAQELAGRDAARDRSGLRGATQDDDHETNAGEHQASPSRPPASSSAGDVLQMVQRARKINKENLRTQASAEPRRHFTDRQVNAQRVQWDDTQISQAASDGTIASRSAKRARTDEIDNDYEVSEDEGFQEDSRPVDIAQRRTRVLPAKRRAFVQVPFVSTSHRPMPAHDSQRSARGSVAFDSGGSDDEPARSRSKSLARRYEIVNSTAKAVVVAQNFREPRERHAWTEDEKAALIEGIEEYGCRWALIKSEYGNYLERRTQVDLKDKARNMKMDYIKAGAGMPRNFQLVHLRKRDIERLEQLGIEL